jgi:hypothetical protein
MVFPPNVDPAAHEQFDQLVGQVSESEAAWAERLATLRRWRSEAAFEPFWPAVDQMLTVDFGSFKRRAGLAASAGDLEGYDFEAWRAQRDYDLKHARHQLP